MSAGTGTAVAPARVEGRWKRSLENLRRDAVRFDLLRISDSSDEDEWDLPALVEHCRLERGTVTWLTPRQRQWCCAVWAGPPDTHAGLPGRPPRARVLHRGRRCGRRRHPGPGRVVVAAMALAVPSELPLPGGNQHAAPQQGPGSVVVGARLGDPAGKRPHGRHHLRSVRAGSLHHAGTGWWWQITKCSTTAASSASHFVPVSRGGCSGALAYSSRLAAWKRRGRLEISMRYRSSSSAASAIVSDYWLQL